MSDVIHYFSRNKQSRAFLDQTITDIDDRHGKSVEYVITIEKNRPVRSLDQNRYYWLILKLAGIETGYTKDQLHAFFKKKFNSEVVFDEVVPKTTSDLDSRAFKIYTEQVKSYVIDFFNVKIVDRRDVTYAYWMEVDSRYKKMYAAA